MKITDNIDDLNVRHYEKIVNAGYDISLLASGNRLLKWLYRGKIREAWERIEDEMLGEWLQDRDFIESYNEDRLEMLKIIEGYTGTNSAKKGIAIHALNERLARATKEQKEESLAQIRMVMEEALGGHQIDWSKRTVREFIHQQIRIKAKVKEQERQSLKGNRKN